MEQQISFFDLIELYRVERLPSDEMVEQLGVVARSVLGYHSFDDVGALNREWILGWRDWLLQERRVSRATWNNYHRHLRALLNFAVSTGRLRESPLHGVTSLSDYSRRKKGIPAEDVRVLVQYLMSPENLALNPGWFWCNVIRFFYYTGVRRRQLVSLQWGHVCFQNELVALMVEGSKTKREWEIPLPPLCRVDLENLKVMCGQVLGRPVGFEDQVFNVTLFNPRYAGDMLSVGQVSGFFRRLKNETGIAVSPKRFRHSFGRQAARTGEIKQVQAQLGHTSVKTTLEYVEPDVEGMRRLGGALEAI